LRSACLGDVQLSSSEAGQYVAIHRTGISHSTNVDQLQNFTPTIAHKIILTSCLLSSNSCLNTNSKSPNEWLEFEKRQFCVLFSLFYLTTL